MASPRPIAIFCLAAGGAPGILLGARGIALQGPPFQTKSRYEDGGFSVGKWIRHDRASHRFQCCPWDGLWNPENNRSDVCKTKEMPVDSNGDFGGFIKQAVQIGGHGCEEILSHGTNVREYENWEWEPSERRLSPWSAEGFCEALGDRRLLIVGDSTMEQTAATIMAMVRGDIPPTDPMILDCLKRIRFSKSDTLTGKMYNHMNRGRQWTAGVKEFRPHLIILSTGAHIDGLSNMSSIVSSVLNDWGKVKKELLASHTKVADEDGVPLRWEPTLIWKTQSPAHEDCHNFSKPIEISADVCSSGTSCAFHLPLEKDMEEFDSEGSIDDIDGPKRWFMNWGQFRSFDRISTEAFHNAGLPVLDVSFLYGRPDAHPPPVWLRKNGGTLKIDCLHYSCPGPLDTIPIILKTMLENGLGVKQT